MRFLLCWVSLSISAAVAGPKEDAVRAGLQALSNQVAIERVTAVADSPLYEVRLASGETLYATENGTHLLSGDLYQALPDNLVNLTEQARWGGRVELMAAVADAETVIFSPDGPVRARIDVFTDIDCGYCRKLHAEIDQYTDLGIEVRYLAFPRAGLQSDSYRKYVSAYCAADPHDALTRAKAGKSVADAQCANPIAAQYELGNQVGVRGTPSIVLASGQLIPGYVPAAELATQMGL
ncbi:thioredoxin fold domain-containing protein [Litorivicinus lipolyticus]|nr:thioredoxin fold domain-containing protein [Litorivicinus lipolyticus]